MTSIAQIALNVEAEHTLRAFTDHFPSRLVPPPAEIVRLARNIIEIRKRIAERERRQAKRRSE